MTFKTSNKLPAHTLYNKLCVFQLQIFAFKKTFAEEMLQATQACTFAFCDGCTKLTEHSCHSPLWAIHQYWEHGRFFFDMNNFMNNLEKRCQQYHINSLSSVQLQLAFVKTELEWLKELQAMVIILS